MPRTKHLQVALLSALATSGALVGCEDDTVPVPAPAPDAAAPPDAASAAEKYKPSLLVTLDQTCNTPDGTRLVPNGDGAFILACPNFNDQSQPAVLKKVLKDGKVEDFYTMPGHPETMKAGPMGMDFGPDGHLYVADHQYRYNRNFKSRLVRVKVQNGQAVGHDVVVEGFKLANAVMFRGDNVFVSDTWFDLENAPGTSGIYRFNVNELNGPMPVKLTPPTETTGDPHLFARFRTMPDRGINLAGADGITFDKQGNLYTGNFGDGVMSKLTLDQAGNLVKQEIFLVHPAMRCVDGIFYDEKTDKIYIADSKDNAIRAVSPSDGTLTTLWENAESNGDNGLLDQPAEPMVRGDELIVVNFDTPPAMHAKNKTHDAPHTISVIKLK